MPPKPTVNFNALSTKRYRFRCESLPTFGTRITPYTFNAHQDFTRGLGFKEEIKPKQIVAAFNENPKLVNSLGDYILGFLGNSRVISPQYNQDPSRWTTRDKRTAILNTQTTSDGHAIYSGFFKPNARGMDIAKDFSSMLHMVSSFPAGRGFLVEPQLYLDAVANGRARTGLPTDFFAKNADRIRAYQSKVYKENRPLTGEIAILGKNAVQFKDHVIVNSGGATIQILRPITMSNHVFHDGHAIWVTVSHPGFPAASFHMYMGHGISNVQLLMMVGDRLNVASGVPTFNDVFASGVTTFEGMPDLVNTFGDKAVSLGLDPDVAMRIDNLLGQKDVALLLDRKIFTTLDKLPFTDAIRFFNPYVPIKCYTGNMLAAAVVGEGDECEITEVDLDDLAQKLEGSDLEDFDALMSILDTYPRTTLDEGLIGPDGQFNVDGYNDMLYVEPTAKYDVFLQDPNALLGEPIDRRIVEQIKPQLDKMVDWVSIQELIDKSISDQVNLLSDVSKPFSDGSSVGEVTGRYLTTEFKQEVYDQLNRDLMSTLGPKSGGFPNLLSRLPIFKDASSEVLAMIAKYPLIDSLAVHTFAAINSVDANGVSYMEARTTEAVTNAKISYYEEPDVKTEVEKEITKRVQDLGDVSDLDASLSKTTSEIEASKQSLAQINEELLQKPTDPDLQTQQATLEAEVEREIENQRELEDKQAESNELKQGSTETSPDTLVGERDHAHTESETAGERVFGGEKKMVLGRKRGRTAMLATVAGSDLLDVPGVVAKMSGKSQTDGWDMACSYTADRLNTVLLNLYNSADSKIVKSISLGSAQNPYSQTYTIISVPGMFKGLSFSITENYTFGLLQPALEFLATTNIAALDMPIQSATVTTTDATLKLLDPQPANAKQITTSNQWYKIVGGAFTPATVDEVDAAINTTGDSSQDSHFDQIAQQFYLQASAPSLQGQTDFQGKIYQLVHLVAETPQPALDANKYVLRALVPLASVLGNQTPMPGNQVVTFDDSGGTASVVLHFTTGSGSGTTFGLYQGNVQTTPDLLTKAPDILDRIQNYFAEQVSDVDYLLTTVDNQTTPVGGIQLTPRSFCFATQTVGSTGVLTIFIQTVESGLEPGGSNLAFEDLNGNAFLPVSSEANATVIYSRGFMSRYYLVQGLQKAGFTSVANSGTDATPVTVTAIYPATSSISIPTMYNVGTFVQNYDSISVDPVPIGGIPVTMSFDAKNNLNLSASIDKTTKIHLYWTVVAPCWTQQEEADKTANIDVELHKQSALQWSESQSGLSLSFSIQPGDFAVTVTSDISNQCDSSTRNSVDSQIQNQVATAIPGVSIPMSSLSALAEVNLLFNGAQVFNLNTQLGVYSPQDVVLFGNI